MANNVVLDAFVPEIWNAGIIRNREAKLVARQICRRNPDAPAKKKGDVVHYSGLADHTINTSWSGTMTYEDLVAAGVDLSIDKNYNYGYKISDIDKAMVDIDAEGSQNQRDGYLLAKKIDTAILNLVEDVPAAQIVTDSSLDATTVIGTIGDCVVMMKEAEITEGNMWIALPPRITQLLKRAGIKFGIRNGLNGSGSKISWTDELGVDVYETTQVPNPSTLHWHVPFGSYDAMVYHEAALLSYNLKDKDDPTSNYLSEFEIFGYKTIRPKELFQLAATVVADTTI